MANEELDRCKEELREERAAVGQARKAAEMAEKRAAEATLEHRIEKEKVLKLLEENSELQRGAQENLSSAEKWKSAYDATCAQLERGQQKIAFLEEENERVAAAFQDKILAKDKIVSDLSEQLKESEERIQDLLLESEGSRRVSKEKEREHEENLGRIIMAIEDEYKDTIKMQQEQVRQQTSIGQSISLSDSVWYFGLNKLHIKRKYGSTFTPSGPVIISDQRGEREVVQAGVRALHEEELRIVCCIDVGGGCLQLTIII